jgi:hypothetical protein
VSHGGARPGSGRKKGGTNRLTEEAVAKAEAGGEMPLDYLLRVMRDPMVEFARRDDAAKAAAPYVHPKRAPIGSDGEDAAGVTVVINKP